MIIISRDIANRRELLRLIVMALQSGGIRGGEQRQFAAAMGEREDYFVQIITAGYEGVTLDRLAELYDAAAGRVGWLTFDRIMRQYYDDIRSGRYLDRGSTLEDVDLKTPHGILTAWSRGRLATQQAMVLLDIDTEDELRAAAVSSGIVPP